MTDEMSAAPVLDPRMLGRVSTPLGSESTQDEFHFWADDRRLVEATQIVRLTMPLPAEDPRVKKMKKQELTVIAIVEVAKRQSEAKTIGDDHGRYGGKGEQEPLLPPAGFGYAHCRVVALEPTIFVPVTEGLPVYLATADEAGRGYSYPDMDQNGTGLLVGLLQNGGSEVSGAAKLDTRFILGENGGHVNVTGVAGVGTKTSFLLVLLKMLILHARTVTLSRPTRPLYITPIVFNVKGNDLMWLNQPNAAFNAQDQQWQAYHDNWGDDLFMAFATPFTEATFFSYPNVNGVARPGLPPGVSLYSWGLKDVLEWGVEKYLLSGEARASELLAGVLTDAFDYVADRSLTTLSGRSLNAANDAGITNFRQLVDWIAAGAVKPEPDAEPHYLVARQHDRATIKAAARRLNNILAEAKGVLREDATSGNPPEIVRQGTCDPIVIDIAELDGGIQRFIVAAIIERVKRHREQNAERPQRYLLVLDELNRFAPKGGTDDVSKLFEHVAAQLRSQGILLFGAQQKASSVSTIVWENAATKVLGRTGAVELSADMWRQALPSATRTRAANLQMNEKILIQEGLFAYPMLALIPLTPWATKRGEIGEPRSAEPDKEVEAAEMLSMGAGA